jgi:hypothetical protein
VRDDTPTLRYRSERVNCIKLDRCKDYQSSDARSCHHHQRTAVINKHGPRLYFISIPCRYRLIRPSVPCSCHCHLIPSSPSRICQNHYVTLVIPSISYPFMPPLTQLFVPFSLHSTLSKCNVTPFSASLFSHNRFGLVIIKDHYRSQYK